MAQAIQPFQTDDDFTLQNRQPGTGLSYDGLQQDDPLTPSYAQSSGSGSTPNLMSGYDTPRMSASSPEPSGVRAPSSSSNLPDFSGMMTQIESASSPAERETLRDKLRRDVASSLSGAGHETKWQGSVLMVDGLPYEVGMSSTGPTTPGGQPIQTATAPNPGDLANAQALARQQGRPQPAVPGVDPNAQALAAQNGTFAGPLGPHADTAAPTLSTSALPTTAGTSAPIAQYGIPAGADPGKFNDASYHSGKYDALRTISKYPPTPEGLAAAVAEINATYGAQYGPMQQIGPDKVSWNGDTIDFIRDVDGNGSWWFGSEQEYAAAHPNGAGPGPALSVPQGGAAGLQLSTSSALPPGATPPPGYVEPPGYGAGTAPNGWQPGQGPGYTPGDIPVDDLPTFSYQDMYDDLTSQSGTDAALQGRIDDLLAHPESLDPLTVETLKAKSKDELAEMQAMDDQELRHSGALMGISDSPWLASERLASRRDRDSALISSNRDIDLQAATTNAADKRSAAQLGLSYTAQQQSARQSAASLAADTTLRAAALKGDRLSLRESVKQKAAELGITQDQVMSNWLQGLMQDATQRYGIDIGADIDWAKLNQEGREFKENLAFQISQLAQRTEEFNAQYGLSLGEFMANRDDEAWDRSQEETSGAGA